MKIAQDKAESKPRKRVVNMLKLYQWIKGELLLVDYGSPKLRHLYERQGYVVKG